MAVYMSNEQFAEILECFADLREEYVSATARHEGAYNDPKTSRSDQDLIIDVSATRRAAYILRNLDEVPISLPSWRYDEWPKIIDAIKHGDKPLTIYRGER